MYLHERPLSPDIPLHERLVSLHTQADIAIAIVGQDPRADVTHHFRPMLEDTTTLEAFGDTDTLPYAISLVEKLLAAPPAVTGAPGRNSPPTVGRRLVNDAGTNVISTIESADSWQYRTRLQDLVLAATEWSVAPEICNYAMAHFTELFRMRCGNLPGNSPPKEFAVIEERFANIAYHLSRYAGAGRTIVDPEDFLRSIMKPPRDDAEMAARHKHLLRQMLAHHYLGDHLFDLCGVDRQELERAWEIGYGQSRLPNNKPDPSRITDQEYKERNALALLHTEAVEPGTPKELSDVLRIRNFGRLGLGGLVRQREALHTKYDQHALALVAGYCDNGAMWGVVQNHLLPLQDELARLKIALHICEVASLQDLAHVEETASKRSWGQAPMLIWAGHRDEDGITLGDNQRNPTDALLDDIHMVGYFAEFVRRRLAPGAVAVGASCSFGKKSLTGDSPAQRLADKSGRTVLTTDSVTALTRLTLSESAGQLVVMPSFRAKRARPNNTWEWYDVDTHTFTPQGAPSY